MPSPKWQGIFEVWKGGLGVWGGIALGTIVGSIVVRRAGANVAVFLDAPRPGCCSPRRSAASATGGTRSCSASRPTCPGGSRSTRRTGRCSTSTTATFHPTFLYELIWDVIGVAVLLYVAPALPDQAAGALRALRRLVHVRPLLRGAAADRPVAPHRRPAAERVGLDHPFRRSQRVYFIWHQFVAEPTGRSKRARAAGAPARRWRSPRAASGNGSTLIADAGRPRARAGPRRLRRALRPPPLARPPRGAAAAGGRSRRDHHRVRREPRRARRARPRRLRRVPGPDLARCSS